MKSTDFNKSITSKALKENLQKQFGASIDLSKYTREQLEDIRNKFRTKVFQHENKAGYNDLLTNETYQKDKAILQLLNTRIKEMLGEDIKKLKDKLVALEENKKGVRAPKHKIHTQGTAAKDWDGDGKKESPKDEVWGSRAKAAAKAGKPFSEAAKPDFLDIDKDGNKKEPMKKAAKEKVQKEGFDDLMKATKERNAPQPSGGAGVKKGKAYGGAAQKDEKEPAKKDKAVKEADKSKIPAALRKAKGGDWKVTQQDLDKEQEKNISGKAGLDKLKKDTGVTEAEDKCNHSAKGKKCPVHGIKECPKMESKPMKKAKALEESNLRFKQAVRAVNEGLARFLREDEEGKAKAITAAGDMVNDYTGWMQRVGQYQTKSMIELADAIRADFGAAEAEAFKQAVGPALSATLEVLTQQREAISNAVAVLAGEAAPEEPMGMEPAPGGDMAPEEPGIEPSEPDLMNEPSGDELAASEPAATSREMRESQFARRLAESHSIMAKLAK